MNKVAVVIPSYKAELDNNEKVSLEQCRKILKNYDRFFLLPDGIEEQYVLDEKRIFVSPVFLSSRKEYSDFVLSEEFYDLFTDYEYILIYQLDSFVFFDKLDHFCSLGFDYIGGEWLYGLECHVQDGNHWFFGNGGFSLRKVSAFKKWIVEQRAAVDYGKMLVPEDLAIAIYGKDYLKIADRNVVKDFAFDIYPQECYMMNEKRLPFGCHGWHRFDPLFWKDIIEKCGYKVTLVDEDADSELLNSGKERYEKFTRFFDVSKLESCIRRLLPSYSGKINVFGAGQFGFSFVNMAKRTSIDVNCILDNDEKKIGKSVEGIPIARAADVLKKDTLPILVAGLKTDAIESQLKQTGRIKGKDYILSRDLQLEMCNAK
ncbi:MAG: hypothetical protein K6E49_07160 [Lachnospiraceae bacterium]|nr:hypothetical protein [Lachnospiraceae bacterium]